MLKKDSKRRWIARARNGGWIPHTAAMQHPGLIDRLREMGLLYSPTIDAWAEGCKAIDQLVDLTICAGLPNHEQEMGQVFQEQVRFGSCWYTLPNAKAPLPPTVT